MSVNRNPGEGRFLSGDHFDSGEIKPIFRKGAGNQPPALIIADQAKPPGFRSEARDLREIVACHAAGVNLDALGVDFFFGAKQARNNREVVDAFGLQPSRTQGQL